MFKAEVAAVYRNARERARVEGTSGLRRQERKAVELARQGRLGTLQRARWAAVRDELAARGKLAMARPGVPTPA
jgi:hypothetical protein